MGHAEVISLDEVRATQHWSQLRQRLHESFDQWLDMLEPHLGDEPMSLSDLTAVMGQLRQDLMGGLTETVMELNGLRWAPTGKLILALRGGVLAMILPSTGEGFPLPTK